MMMLRSIVFVTSLASAFLGFVDADAIHLVVHNDVEDETTTTTTMFSNDETAFLKVPDPRTARSNLKFITREPHIAGTMGDRIMADFVVQSFETSGIPDVSIFELDVLLNYPQARPKVTLWKQENSDDNHDKYNNDHGDGDTMIFDAPLSEDILLPQDETSDTIWRNHTFHGYSPSGHVRRAPMIYANYGRPTDFDTLTNAGIDINGTVVLVRYGKCFRGLKVRNAQRLGAVAVLIYSDPADDGYKLDGKTYPDGAWRPESGVQRGSVQFNSACAGDPMRADKRYPENAVQDLCGVSSYKDLIPTIPSLPISYGDATPLLQHMGGPLAKDIGGEEFCGGITNLTYRVGPSNTPGSNGAGGVVIEVKVQNKQEVKSVPNVVGVIPGTLPPEQDMPVLLGNHRDAWVYGAADPNSGTASLLEVARGLGALYRDHGWRPLRSIYLLSWSGEEYGLLGSTGWAELNQDKNHIQRALAYINVDTVVSGDHLEAAASPSLTTIWKRVLKDMTSSSNKEHAVEFDNGPFGSLVDGNTNWKWRSLTEEQDEPSSVETMIGYPEIGVLGSGSDYTVFLDHFGIPSLDFSFGKKAATYGQYHSIYDSFAWMDKFGGRDGQPGSSFELMAFAAKIWGILAMRLATSPLVPLDHVAQGVALSQYATAIEQQSVKLDLGPLKEAIQSYQEAAASLQVQCVQQNKEEEVDDKDARDGMEEGASNDIVVSKCNEKLGMTERQFLDKNGLPGRSWFKHVLQAPGMDLGYAAEAFPGIQQAIDDGKLSVAQEQVAVTSERVKAAADNLRP